jgi:hypothetical protein
MFSKEAAECCDNSFSVHPPRAKIAMHQKGVHQSRKTAEHMEET